MAAKRPSSGKRKRRGAKRARAAGQGGEQAGAGAASPQGTFVTAEPVFRRNPEAPIFYAPLVDVRTTRQDLHLVLYVPPAAGPHDVYDAGEGPRILVESSAEVVVPVDAAEQLIVALTSQYRQLMQNLLEQEAEGADIEVGEIELAGLAEALGMTTDEESQ